MSECRWDYDHDIYTECGNKLDWYEGFVFCPFCGGKITPAIPSASTDGAELPVGVTS